MKRTVISVAVAMAAMAISTTVALAVEAVVLRDSPVYRSRTSNNVVNMVDEDQIVDVVECRRSRCRLEDIPGRDGWVRQDRLAPLDDEGDAQPGLSFQFNLGPGGPGISIGVGNGGGGVNVGVGSGGPDSGPRVCLYNGEGYTGERRCFADGTAGNLTSLGWNDVASSVRTYGGADVRLCEHVQGGGACYTFNGNAPALGGFDNQASYIEVY